MEPKPVFLVLLPDQLIGIVCCSNPRSAHQLWVSRVVCNPRFFFPPSSHSTLHPEEILRRFLRVCLFVSLFYYIFATVWDV
jgi:hypothetical protein